MSEHSEILIDAMREARNGFHGIFTFIIRDVVSPFIESWGSRSVPKGDDDSDDNGLSIYQLAPKEAKSFFPSVMRLSQRSHKRVKRRERN